MNFQVFELVHYKGCTALFGVEKYQEGTATWLHTVRVFTLNKEQNVCGLLISLRLPFQLQQWALISVQLWILWLFLHKHNQDTYISAVYECTAWQRQLDSEQSLCAAVRFMCVRREWISQPGRESLLSERPWLVNEKKGWMIKTSSSAMLLGHRQQEFRWFAPQDTASGSQLDSVIVTIRPA